MSRDYGVNTALTGTNDVPLFYNEHPVVDQPFTLAMGESVATGDLVYFQAEGEDYSEPVASDANVGDGTIVVDSFNEGSQLGTYTIVYDAVTLWSVFVDGVEESNNNATGQMLAGGLTVTIAAGDVPFEDGDTFTIVTYATGSVYAYKATTLANLSGSGVLVAGRDTDATDGPEPTFGYATGVFNINAIGNWGDILVNAGGADPNEVIRELGIKGIHVKEGLK